MSSDTKSAKQAESRGSKKPYAKPGVRAYGNIHDITMAQPFKNLPKKDGNAKAPNKTF